MNTRSRLTAVLCLLPMVALCQMPPVLRTEFTTNTAVGAITVTGTITNYFAGNVVVSNLFSNTMMFSIDGLTNTAGAGSYSDGYSVSVGSGVRSTNLAVAIGHNSLAKDEGVSIGYMTTNDSHGSSVGSRSAASNYGAAIGVLANAQDLGAAVGYGANGSANGVSVGSLSTGYNYGVAVGNLANGSNYGVSFGPSSIGYDLGVGIGSSADGNSYGVSIGAGSIGGRYGVSVGVGSSGSDGGVGIGDTAQGTGRGNVAIGSYAQIDSLWTNTVQLGSGTASLPGALNFHDYVIMDSSGVFVGNAMGLTNVNLTNTTGTLPASRVSGTFSGITSSNGNVVVYINNASSNSLAVYNTTSTVPVLVVTNNRVGLGTGTPILPFDCSSSASFGGYVSAGLTVTVGSAQYFEWNNRARMYSSATNAVDFRPASGVGTLVQFVGGDARLPGTVLATNGLTLPGSTAGITFAGNAIQNPAVSNACTLVGDGTNLVASFKDAAGAASAITLGSGTNVILSSSFSGNGVGLTNLPASQVSGTFGGITSSNGNVSIVLNTNPASAIWVGTNSFIGKPWLCISNGFVGIGKLPSSNLDIAGDISGPNNIYATTVQSSTVHNGVGAFTVGKADAPLVRFLGTNMYFGATINIVTNGITLPGSTAAITFAGNAIQNPAVSNACTLTGDGTNLFAVFRNSGGALATNNLIKSEASIWLHDITNSYTLTTSYSTLTNYQYSASVGSGLIATVAAGSISNLTAGTFRVSLNRSMRFGTPNSEAVLTVLTNDVDCGIEVIFGGFNSGAASSGGISGLVTLPAGSKISAGGRSQSGSLSTTSIGGNLSVIQVLP